MHVLHVTPHLPPDQAANALLPWQLGKWASHGGDTVEYLAHTPRATGTAEMPGPVTWVPRRRRTILTTALRLGSAMTVYRVRRALAPILERADLVHVHSNGLLSELALLLAARAGKPTVLTLYGTEIWHYRAKRPTPDLFTRAYHAAAAVTFYSDRLMMRAQEVGLNRRGLHVIYPPVSHEFSWQDLHGQNEVRAALSIPNRHVLLNVKRLHPLAGQRYLIEAMNEVIRVFPDIRLIICGTGPSLADLQAVARSSGVERHVDFAGLLDNAVIARYCAAADLFVLPSLLEALPTVAVEALASGTPVLSTDNPGGVELNDIFGQDVAMVPREQYLPLAEAIVRFLRHKRRTLPATRAAVERMFRPEAVASQYRDTYRRVAGG